jgi:hypothetical protein
MTHNALSLLALLTVLSIASSGALAKPAKTLPVKPDLRKAEVMKQAQQDLLLEIDGRIYPKDSLPQQCEGLLKGVKCPVDSFGHYHVEARKEADLVHSLAVFSAPEGPQVIEESWEKDGRVIKARIENKALGKVSLLEVKDGKVHYTVTQKDGDVDTSTDDSEENLVVPSTVMSYIRPHFAEILRGEKVKLKVAVLDRRESFTFYMKKYKEEKAANGDDILVLEMAPGSIIVKALVSPMYFYLNAKSGELFAFEGRSALRRKEGDKYKELDVRAAYEYKVNAYNLQKASAKNDALPIGNCSKGEMLVPGQAGKCEVKSE